MKSAMLNKLSPTLSKEIITGIFSNILVSIIFYLAGVIFKISIFQNIINSQLGWFSIITFIPCIFGFSFWKKESSKFKIGTVILTLITLSSFIISGTTDNPEQMVAEMRKTVQNFSDEIKNKNYEIYMLQNANNQLREQIILLDDSKKQSALIEDNLSNKNANYEKEINSKNKDVNRLKQNYEDQIKKLKADKSNFADMPSKKYFNQILSLSNQKRDDSIRNLDDKVNQIQLLIYAGIKNEYAMRLKGVPVSQQAIDIGHKVFNNYISALNSTNEIKSHFVKILTDEYDKLLLDNFDKQLIDYQTILLKRPVALDRFDKVSEDIKSIIANNQNDFNAKIVSYIEKYLNDSRKSFTNLNEKGLND